MGRWVATLIGTVVAAIGVLLVWTVRASGGICVDGAYDTGERFGYCADYDSATGALPATIAIGVLLVATLTGHVASRPGLAVVLVVLIAVATVAGLVANLTMIDYPEGYPR